jgi:hypothetical protein
MCTGSGTEVLVAPVAWYNSANHFGFLQIEQGQLFFGLFDARTIIMTPSGPSFSDIKLAEAEVPHTGEHVVYVLGSNAQGKKKAVVWGRGDQWVMPAPLSYRVLRTTYGSGEPVETVEWGGESESHLSNLRESFPAVKGDPLVCNCLYDQDGNYYTLEIQKLAGDTWERCEDPR